MDITAIVAVICTAYTLIVGRLLVMHSDVYCEATESPAPSARGRVIQWTKAVVYYIVALTCSATSAIVFMVILQWYWSVFW